MKKLFLQVIFLSILYIFFSPANLFAQIVVTGGDATIDIPDDTSGGVNFPDAVNRTATVVDGKNVVGAVTTGTNNQGTVTAQGDSTFLAKVGDVGAALKAVNAGAAGKAVTFSNDVYTQSLNISGTGTVNLDGTLNGAASFKADGVLKVADGQDVTGLVTTVLNNKGTLTSLGTNMFYGQVGASGFALKAVNGGADTSISTFGSDVYTKSLNVTGTGVVDLLGNLTGATNFQDDGTVMIADGMDMTGAVTTDNTGKGALTSKGTNTISGQIGASAAQLNTVNGGYIGKTSTFSGDIYAQTLNVTQTGTVALGGNLNGAAVFNGDGTITVADTKQIAGTVTTAADNTGTLTSLGTNTFSSVGASGKALNVVNGGASSATSTFSGNVFATTLNVTGTGTVALGGDLNGAAAFNADGVLSIGAGTITGAVTTATTDTGTLTSTGSSTVSGQVGLLGTVLKAVNGGVAGATSTFSSDIYATNLNVTGTGTVALAGTLNGAAVFGGDGTLTVADSKAITGTVTTGTNNTGTLTLSGSNSFAGLVGAANFALKAVNGGANTATTTFLSDVYAQSLNITGTGTVALGGNLTGTATFNDDGLLTVADAKDISGAVTTAVNNDGTLTLLGTNTVSGQVGTATNALNAVNAGVNGTVSIFSGDVYAQNFNVTGTGNVWLHGALNAPLVYQGDGGVTLDNASGNGLTATIGQVVNSTGSDTQGILNFSGVQRTGGTIGIVGGQDLRAINITNGTLFLAHDIAAGVITADQNAGFVLVGNRTIQRGDVSLGHASGGGGIALENNLLTISNGNLTADAGSTILLNANSSSDYGRIKLTAGDASIASGATINLNIGGYVRNGSVLKIVDGVAGSGVAPNVNVVDNSSILQFMSDASSGPDLNITATANYDPVNIGGSTQAAGKALATVDARGPSADMQKVFDSLYSLSSASQVSGAVKQMVPLEKSVVMSTTHDLASGGMQAIASHLVTARNGGQAPVNRMDLINSSLDQVEGASQNSDSSGYSSNSDSSGFSSGEASSDLALWAKAFGTTAHQDSSQTVPGYKALGSGVILGADLLKTDIAIMGLAAGYAFSVIDAEQSNMHPLDIKHFPVVLYAEFNQDGPWRVDASVSGALNTYSERRMIDFGSIHRTARAYYDGQQYNAHIEAAYPMRGEESITMVPSAFLDYGRTYFSGYTEQGAGDLDLNVKAQDYSQFRPGLGLAMSSSWNADDVVVTPQIYAKWSYDLIEQDVQTVAAFNGTGVYFNTQEIRMPRETWNGGLSCGFSFPRSTSIELTYDAEIKKGYLAHYVSALVKRRF
ncbi:MAG: autotransporter domain-containing protein [Candidatus Omnitrophica bacterium]|nr:autotransporter domain-containing protein [Candidatus Omnitrophota bacterium]